MSNTNLKKNDSRFGEPEGLVTSTTIATNGGISINHGDTSKKNSDRLMEIETIIKEREDIKREN